MLQHPSKPSSHSQPKGGHRGFIVYISRFDQEGKECIVAKMNFLVLAGYVDPKQINNGGGLALPNCNKSMYALMNVVQSLNSNQSFIPYRQSKLTRILRDSLFASLLCSGCFAAATVFAVISSAAVTVFAVISSAAATVKRLLRSEANRLNAVLIACLDEFSSQDTVSTLSLASRSSQVVNEQCYNLSLGARSSSKSNANHSASAKNLSSSVIDKHNRSQLNKSALKASRTPAANQRSKVTTCSSKKPASALSTYANQRGVKPALSGRKLFCPGTNLPKEDEIVAAPTKELQSSLGMEIQGPLPNPILRRAEGTMAAAAKLSDDLVGDIFLRLSPDDPVCLLRASLVCKRWRRILADPAFRRRHRALHRMPPVVGFIAMVNGAVPYASRFVANNSASGRPASCDLPPGLMLDCLHGRALFLITAPWNLSGTNPGTNLICDLVVCDPLTKEKYVPSPLPTVFPHNCAAAVLCAAVAEGCNHRACHKGPFLVVFISSHSPNQDLHNVTSAFVYSSVTGDWSKSISVEHPGASIDIMHCPGTLVGDKLYFSCVIMHYAFEYVLGAHRLSIIKLPPPLLSKSMFSFLMSMEDGGLGCIGVEGEPTPCLCLWSRVLAPQGDGVESWEVGRTIELETLLPKGALPAQRLSDPSSMPSAHVVGVAEGTDVVFVGTKKHVNRGAVYMVQLNSRKARKVYEKCTRVVPYTSFCIPVMDSASTDEDQIGVVSRA
ncbi:hypothetical protein EJB05_41274 [Eragrostis curvula]|uniref:Kinesin motor domain-containing protein n=1 Tax=Eragrostis curvula TaxID=38414 RepID=A0A5J9TAC1_9POAL|nr:hypothetical protein EJB05_41274 [Eragrostis curvula]